jgi:hypothetical protein
MFNLEQQQPVLSILVAGRIAAATPRNPQRRAADTAVLRANAFSVNLRRDNNLGNVSYEKKRHFGLIWDMNDED